MKHLRRFFESIKDTKEIEDILYPFKSLGVIPKILNGYKNDNILQINLFHENYENLASDRESTWLGITHKSIFFHMNEDCNLSIQHLISYMNDEGWIFSHDYYHILDLDNFSFDYNGQDYIISRKAIKYNLNNILYCNYDDYIMGITLFFKRK